MVSIARQMRHQSLAREHCGTIKETLVTEQFVGCTMDGCRPHDINGGGMHSYLRSNKRKYFNKKLT